MAVISIVSGTVPAVNHKTPKQMSRELQNPLSEAGPGQWREANLRLAVCRLNITLMIESACINGYVLAKVSCRLVCYLLPTNPRRKKRHHNLQPNNMVSMA
jgi:hypothetical protein